MFREEKEKRKFIPRTWNNETMSVLYFLQLFFIHVWGQITLLQDWTLQIKFVQQRDAGLYECQVSSHPPTSIFIQLKVVGEYFIFIFPCSKIHVFRRPTRCSSKPSLFVSLPSHSTCFGCLPHPSSGVHKL